MLFSIDRSGNEITEVPEENHSTLDILERDDLEEWIIREPALLEEDLLIIASEYAMFEDTRDRLDILALDAEGKLVVAELKRDKADRTTDLQAIKYASYCSTLTAEQIQKDYRAFWNQRSEDENLTPEDVGRAFSEHLNEMRDEETLTTEEGWADFDLDDQPRIILASGSYDTEVTSPVMWLVEEYGLDISCVQIEAYEHQQRIILSSQQLVPPPEAEEYMTRRREKKEQQQSDISEINQKYQAFFQDVIDTLREKHDFTNAKKGQPQNWYSFASGYSEISYIFSFAQGNQVRTGVRIEDGDPEKNTNIFKFLERRKTEIEEELGTDLKWEQKEQYKACLIAIYREGTIWEDQETIEEIKEWGIQHLLDLKQTFDPYFSKCDLL